MLKTASTDEGREAEPSRSAFGRRASCDPERPFVRPPSLALGPVIRQLVSRTRRP